MVTGSTLWPNATGTATSSASGPVRPRDLPLQAGGVDPAQGIQRYGYANFSRYPGTLPPGISRNAYGLLGSASVLIEMRGDIGHKSNGYLAKTAYLASASVVDALADRSLYSADIGIAEALQLAPGSASLEDKDE